MFLMPIFFAFIQTFVLQVYFKEEPIKFCISQNKDKQASCFLKRAYLLPNDGIGMKK